MGPVAVPVTLTETVQVPLAARLPPLKVRVVAPAEGDHVPPQVVAAAGVLATCIPVCSVSVNASPVSPMSVFGLVSVNVRVDVPFSPIVVGEKALERVGLAQLVNVTLSIEIVCPVTPFDALKKYRRKTVLPLVLIAVRLFALY